MTAPRTLILRLDRDQENIPEHVRRKVMALTTPDTIKEIRELAADEKHIIHYERRINAIEKGIDKLLDSIDLKPPRRNQLDAAFTKLATEKLEALKKIDADHTKIITAKRATLLNARAEELNRLPTPLYTPIHSDMEPQQTNKAIMALDAQIQVNNKDVGSIDPYQDVLEAYVTEVKKLLREQAYIPHKEIKKALGAAEEYACIEEGSHSFCTVTWLNADQDLYPNGTWLIQSEIPQDPLSEAQKAELLSAVLLIHSGESKAAPQWYQEMSEIEQKIFFDTFKDARSINDITTLLPSISSKLRSIPGLANFSRHVTVLMDADATVTKPIAVNTLSRSSHVASRDIHDTDQRAAIAEGNINQVIDNMLVEKVTALAQLRVTQGNDPAGKPIVLPVLLQTLITPANKTGPDAKLLKDRDNAIAKLQEYKLLLKPENDFKQEEQTHPTLVLMNNGSYRLWGLKDHTWQFTEFNHLKLPKEWKKLNEVTISGDTDPNILSLLKQHHTPPHRKVTVEVTDSVTQEKRKVEVEVALSLIGTNHPLNELRYWGAGTGTSGRKVTSTTPEDKLSSDTNKRDMQRLIQLAQCHMEEYGESPALKMLVTQYQSVLRDAVSSIQDKELYLSSLEQLIAASIGIPYGSCVSGKDRKGISTIYTDAMTIYINLYKNVPPIAGSSKERTHFVRLFAEIYVTRHQQEHAGQKNAPGSDGIKTPIYYLPNDILFAIVKRTFNQFIHKQCDRLASNNEVGKIAKARAKKFVGSISKAINSITGRNKEEKKENIPVSEEENKLINQIQDVLNTLPEKIKNATGIHQLINQLDNPKKDHSLHALATICRNRIEKSTHDRPSLEVYKIIIELACNPKSDAALKKLAGLHSKLTLKDDVGLGARQQSTLRI